jgi:hypothetical protein
MIEAWPHSTGRLLSLRVAGDDLRPEEITALLGIDPSIAYAKAAN